MTLCVCNSIKVGPDRIFYHCSGRMTQETFKGKYMKHQQVIFTTSPILKGTIPYVANIVCQKYFVK